MIANPLIAHQWGIFLSGETIRDGSPVVALLVRDLGCVCEYLLEQKKKKRKVNGLKPIFD